MAAHQPTQLMNTNQSDRELGAAHYRGEGGVGTAGPYHDTLEPFFGPPSKAMDDSPSNHFPHEAWFLPDAYLGRNDYVRETIVQTVVNYNSWMTSEVLPWRKQENPNIAWDSIKFDKTLVDMEPEQGVPRYVTVEREAHTDYMVRRGLALIVNHGFASTPGGQKDFMYKVATIAGAVQETCDQSGLLAMLRSKNEYTFHRSDSIRRASDAYDMFQQELWRFGIIQMTERGWYHMDAEAQNVMQLANVDPDTWIVPNRMTSYVAMGQPAETEVYRAGEKVARANLEQGKDRFTTFRGKKVFETRPYQLDVDGRVVDPLNRNRMIGDFFVVPCYNATTGTTTGAAPRNTKKDGATQVYCCETDRFETFKHDILCHESQFSEAVKHCPQSGHQEEPGQALVGAQGLALVKAHEHSARKDSGGYDTSSYSIWSLCNKIHGRYCEDASIEILSDHLTFIDRRIPFAFLLAVIPKTTWDTNDINETLYSLLQVYQAWMQAVVPNALNENLGNDGVNAMRIYCLEQLELDRNTPGLIRGGLVWPEILNATFLADPVQATFLNEMMWQLLAEMPEIVGLVDINDSSDALFAVIEKLLTLIKDTGMPAKGYQLAEIHQIFEVAGLLSMSGCSGATAGNMSPAAFLGLVQNNPAGVAFDLLCVRPFRQYTMGTGILLQKGSGLGNTFRGWADFQLTDNIIAKTHIGHFTFWHASVVTNPKCLFLAEDIFCTNYVSGEGKQVLSWNNMEDFWNDPMSTMAKHNASIICLPVPVGAANLDDHRLNLNNPISLTGSLDPVTQAASSHSANNGVDIGNYNVATSDTRDHIQRHRGRNIRAPTVDGAELSAYYNNLFKFGEINHEVDYENSGSFDSAGRLVNTICFHTMQKHLNPHNGRWEVTNLNTGHFGENGIYEGVKKIRCGFLDTFKQMDYQKSMAMGGLNI